jgi:hypothetical protein
MNLQNVGRTQKQIMKPFKTRRHESLGKTDAVPLAFVAYGAVQVWGLIAHTPRVAFHQVFTFHAITLLPETPQQRTHATTTLPLLQRAFTRAETLLIMMPVSALISRLVMFG